MIYFRIDLWRYFKAWIASMPRSSIRSTDERLAWALVVGTIPGVIAGALFESAIEDTLGQPWLIAVMLAVFGVVLYVVDRICRSDRDWTPCGPRRAVLGARAGAGAATRGVALRRDDHGRRGSSASNREAAARFSFLLAIPIIAGAGLLQGRRGVQDGFQGYGPSSSRGSWQRAISGFVVIWFLLRYLRRHDFLIFMVYRLAVAALVFLLIATGVRSATI